MTSVAGRDGVAARHRLLWRLLLDALAAVTEAGRGASVLDCGGGTGTFAVPLAEAGAHVTVVDISADALATLGRRAQDSGVAGRVRPLQGDVEALADVIGAQAFDLVLAHGVLEAVDDVPAAVSSVAGAVRPGGLLSVLVANPDASVLVRAVSGDVQAALTELRAALSRAALPTPAGAARAVLTPADVVSVLRGRLGFAIEATHGIGIFSELVPGADLEARAGAADALFELEQLASVRSPYRDIAARMHILARAHPASGSAGGG